MYFLNTQEKVRLQKILAKSSKFQDASQRNACLTLCDLKERCSSIALDQSTDKFVSNLTVELSKFEILSGNSKKLGLVVLLEYIIAFGDYDNDLSQEDQEFIEDVITKWEQSKKQSVIPKKSQQKFQPNSYQTPSKQEVNIQQPVSNKPKSVQTKNNRQNPLPKQRRNSTQPSINTVRYTIIICKKIWFILVFIVIIWSVVGVFSQWLITNGPSSQMLSVLIICGFLGAICSSFLGGWLALKLVAPSIQLETSLIYSAIKIVAEAIGWIIVGMVAYNSNMLQENGQFIGLIFGLMIAIAIVGWLNLISHRS